MAPAFVDAHVHATSAGLLRSGIDLADCPSLADCLDQVRERARTLPEGAVLWGHGWDETRWPEGRPPSSAELDDVAGGAAVYLSRVDVHSAVVSTALLDPRARHAGAPMAGPSTVR